MRFARPMRQGRPDEGRPGRSGAAAPPIAAARDGPSVMTPSDAELLDRQAALQAEATAALDDLDLLARIGEVGSPTRTGSSAYGLMVARDIDITTLCPVLDTQALYDAIRPLAGHPRVRRLSFRNDTGHWNTDPAYPDGLHWMVEYVAEAGAAWNLDLWFLRDGTTQFDLDDLRTLPPRLTPETRVAILRIKEAVAARAGADRVRSHLVYEAVLDHGIRTPEEFERHLARR